MITGKNHVRGLYSQDNITTSNYQALSQ